MDRVGLGTSKVNIPIPSIHPITVITKLHWIQTADGTRELIFQYPLIYQGKCNESPWGLGG